jgi:NAD(P)-dependent dehydrogenase (short-subunit alcohol dehydrogenase family)
MIPRGGGKIINIGSNFGGIAFKSRSVYTVAKADLHHMTNAQIPRAGHSRGQEDEEDTRSI